MMGSVIYKCEGRRDGTLRCYLTLDCRSSCPYCSLLVPFLSVERRKAQIPPEVWAEGINRRGRDVILTGGEPLLYSGLVDLVRLITVHRIDIHTNLQHSVDGFLGNGIRQVSFLASLHQAGSVEMWLEKARALVDAKHRVRCHVIKYGSDWKEREEAIKALGIRVKSCDNYEHRRQPRYPYVKCICGRYHYGPDGYRYICTKTMGMGSSFGRLEHISEGDGSEFNEIECTLFGDCTACDLTTKSNVTTIEEPSEWE
jgi:organic radical activating enzyme